jgi:ADP-heptose:LPS heptosyltransferase
MTEKNGPTEAAIRKGPIKCLVIQMARIGDTLQSLMALRAAKQLYPDLEIHFMAREKFAHAAKRVPWIEKVHSFPTERILAPLLKGEGSEQQAIADVAAWMGPLASFGWDFVINWTYSDSSSFVAALLPARVKLGFTRGPQYELRCADGWSQYIHGIVQGGVEQNIHLTDILTTQLLTALQIHVGEPTNAGNAPVTSKSFFSLKVSEPWRVHSNRWIGIQLGASQETKTWPAESWAKLASYIIRRHPEHNVVLLGGKEDLAKADRFMAAFNSLVDREQRNPTRLVSLVGETDFDLWASVVSRCQWVFGADTAAIHLASVLGTRVLNVSVGPVRWSETGPYGNGHYVIAGEVTPEACYTAWSYASSEWSHRRGQHLEAHASDLGLSEPVKGAQIYRSRIRGTNDGGGVVYEPITNDPLSLQHWTSSVLGHVARSWYCGWVPPVGQELAREQIRPELIRQLRELQESSQVLHKICEQAVSTATWLSRKSIRLKSDRLMEIVDKEELQAMSDKLRDLERLADRLGNTHPPLRAFSQMCKVLMHNLRAKQIAELGRESAEAYRQLRDGVAIFRDWVKFSLELAKPRSVTEDLMHD